MSDLRTSDSKLSSVTSTGTAVIRVYLIELRCGTIPGTMRWQVRRIGKDRRMVFSRQANELVRRERVKLPGAEGTNADEFMPLEC